MERRIDFMTAPASTSFRDAQGLVVGVDVACVLVDAAPEGQAMWHEGRG